MAMPSFVEDLLTLDVQPPAKRARTFQCMHCSRATTALGFCDAQCRGA
jgi:hypothetical protein